MCHCGCVSSNYASGCRTPIYIPGTYRYFAYWFCFHDVCGSYKASYSGASGDISPRGKAVGTETCFSPLSKAEFENTWKYICSLPLVFMKQCLIKLYNSAFTLQVKFLKYGLKFNNVLRSSRLKFAVFLHVTPSCWASRYWRWRHMFFFFKNGKLVAERCSVKPQTTGIFIYTDMKTLNVASSFLPSVWDSAVCPGYFIKTCLRWFLFRAVPNVKWIERALTDLADRCYGDKDKHQDRPRTRELNKILLQGCLTVHLPHEIKLNASLMQLGNFIDVFLADGARHHPHRTHDLRSVCQDHHPSKNSVQKTVCCNSTSNAPDGGPMYPKHVELKIH